MLKFFFYRSSKFALATEIVGVFLAAFLARRLYALESGRAVWFLYFVFVAVYAFMRFCAIWRFYEGVPRCSGIELHFNKMVLAAGYTLAIISAVALVMSPLVPLMVGAILMVAMVHINVIFIYLRFKDTDNTPPNLFSGRCAKN